MRARVWLGIGLGALAGCSTCGGGDRTVPFKRGSSVEAPARQPSGVAPQSDPAAAAQATASEGQRYEGETRRIEVKGLALELAEGAIRASLEVRLDEAPALLLMVTDAKGALTLAQAQPLAGAWSPAASIGDLELPATCRLVTAGMQALNESYAVARAELACGADPSGAAATGPISPPQPAPHPALSPRPPPATTIPRPGSPPPPTTPSRPLPAAGQRPTALHQWVITLESVPRVLEHFATALPTAAEPGALVAASLQSRELDGDGNADLVLALDVGTPEQTSTRIEVELLNRAGGLARDPAEPEATLLLLADQAKMERRKNAPLARSLAERVLAIHDALCRESPSARLRVGSVLGLDCGASLAAGRAASVLCALRAAQGQVIEALDLYRALQSGAYRLTDNDWERARQALAAKVDSTSITWQPGPALALDTGLDVRRSAIAFIDETHLLLRGAAARSYDVTSGTIEATGIDGSTSVTDPSGRFAVSAVLRSCEGYHLRIVETAHIVAGRVAGPSVSEPLIVAENPAPNARCPEDAPQPAATDVHQESGGFRVLGWSAQGVLLVRDHALWLLPMAADGTPADTQAEVLAADAQLAPLPQSAELTPDGHHQAVLTPLGIAIVDRPSGSTRLIALPQTGPPDPSSITDVALSPSAGRVAFLRGAQVFIGTPGPAAELLAGEHAPAPPDPPAPPAVQ
jgi:hypothetical protein